MLKSLWTEFLYGNNASVLDEIRVASPCSASWEEMYGNDRKRFCGDCNLHVYNLPGMSRREAEELIARSEGGLCVRFYRRGDGTILTRYCPVGWARVKKRISVMATGALAIFISAFTGGFLSSLLERKPVAGDVVGTIPVSATKWPP